MKKPDSETALLATAYHEAGHAVMACHVNRPVQKVTVTPGNLQAGGVRLGACEMKKGRSRASRDWIEDEVLIYFAGMVGESQFTGQYDLRGAHQDLQMIRRLLRDRAKTEKQLDRLERRLLDKTEHILGDEVHVRAVSSIAQELVAKLTISGRAVEHLIALANRLSD